MHIETFYDAYTFTFTHVIVDKKNKKSAIIDSVTDFDRDSGRVTYSNADKVIKYIKENNLENQWILESHIHADHISASSYLQKHVGGKTAMGSGIKDILEFWIPRFNIAHDTKTDGSQFDRLFENGDKFNIGDLEVTVWHTPGHTPACASYLVKDVVFVGDTIFMPKIGTARCDFPGGNAEDLYESIKRFYDLPDNTRLYLCHDYPLEGEEPVYSITVGEQKNNNSLLKANTTKEEYVANRLEKDKNLAVPRLLLPSIQANMRLGEFGNKESNGMQYIKIPINLF